MKLKRKIIGLLGDDKGGGWHQSISPTTVLVRSSNAAARLPLRGQSEREALARLLLRSQARCKEKPRYYM